MPSPTPSLIIRVESVRGPIPADAFLRVARDVCALATEVAGAGSGPHSVADEIAAFFHTAPQITSRWRIVGADCFSPQDTDGVQTRQRARDGVSLTITSADDAGAVERILAGIKSIHDGGLERPADFSDGALRALRRVSLAAGRTYFISLSKGHGEGEAVALDANLVGHIDAWLAGHLEAMGSIDGRLELISIHNRPRFTVYGRGGSRVECFFTTEMLGEVMSALGQRVAIRGLIRYGHDGRPSRVEARYLRRLQGSTPLPIPPSASETSLSLQTT